MVGYKALIIFIYIYTHRQQISEQENRFSYSSGGEV